MLYLVFHSLMRLTKGQNTKLCKKIHEGRLDVNLRLKVLNDMRRQSEVNLNLTNSSFTEITKVH